MLHTPSPAAVPASGAAVADQRQLPLFREERWPVESVGAVAVLGSAFRPVARPSLGPITGGLDEHASAKRVRWDAA